MKFLHNVDSNHSKHLIELISKSTEICIAIAFLKSSGASLLASALDNAIKRGATVTIIAGQHFALTEPKALLALEKLFRDKEKATLRLAHAESKTSVFHPKLYLFSNLKEGTIVCGSANVTHGGWESNLECSLMVTCSTNESTWIEALDHFKLLASDGYSETATLLSIGQYSTFFDAQRAARKLTRAIPNKTHLDYSRLIKLAAWTKTDEWRAKILQKKKHYREAKGVLDIIADTERITTKKFTPLLEELVGKKGEHGWWYSGSLLRNKNSVFNRPSEFKELVLLIREGVKKRSRAELFEEATTRVKSIEGAGVNYVTEIMMSYSPERFANLNASPIKVLKEKAGVLIKAVSTSFSGADYEAYCEIVEEINGVLGLKSMLEADAFFNKIYWELYNKEKSKSK